LQNDFLLQYRSEIEEATGVPSDPAKSCREHTEKESLQQQKQFSVSPAILFSLPERRERKRPYRESKISSVPSDPSGSPERMQGLKKLPVSGDGLQFFREKGVV
jgi:hypothetical protein